MTRIALITFLAATFVATAASAHGRPFRGDTTIKRLPKTSITMRRKMQVERRMGLHIKRIQAGLKDGSLNFKEARRLFRATEKVDAKLHGYMRDRRLTRREAVRLNRMLDKNSRKINGLRHNRFVRLLGPIPIRLERPDRIRVPTPRELSAPPVGHKRIPVPVTSARPI